MITEREAFLIICLNHYNNVTSTEWWVIGKTFGYILVLTTITMLGQTGSLYGP